MATRTIKWETLKRKAIELVSDYYNPTYSDLMTTQTFNGLLYAVVYGQPPKKVLQEGKQWAVNLIKAWDIRRSRKLIEIFPAIVPEFYRDLPMKAEYNEEGEWVITFGCNCIQKEDEDVVMAQE